LQRPETLATVRMNEVEIGNEEKIG